MRMAELFFFFFFFWKRGFVTQASHSLCQAPDKHQEMLTLITQHAYHRPNICAFRPSRSDIPNLERWTFDEGTCSTRQPIGPRGPCPIGEVYLSQVRIPRLMHGSLAEMDLPSGPLASKGTRLSLSRPPNPCTGLPCLLRNASWLRPAYE